MTCSIELVASLDDTEDVEELVREYLEWAVPRFNDQNGLAIDIAGAVATAMSGVSECLPPNGRTLLARGADGAAVGIGFLRRIRPEAAEIKRLYLQPRARGAGLARQMVRLLCSEARAMGCSEVYLDTAAFMTSAHALYRSEGFSEIDAYPEADHSPEVSPHVLYMFRRL